MPSFNRKNIRLPGYDYSQIGAYFITICTLNKQNILWEDNNWHPTRPNETPPLSPTGKLVDFAVRNISKIYDYVSVEKYAILPNHVHLLLVISIDDDKPVVPTSVSTIIKQFKGYVTKTSGKHVWQKSFYDRIVRNEQECQTIWEYIDANPLNWAEES